MRILACLKQVIVDNGKLLIVNEKHFFYLPLTIYHLPLVMKVPVLAYHKIDFPPANVKIRGAFTTPRRFAKQLRYLKKCGFDFYTAAELTTFYRANGAFPKRAICLTFDDGWQDNYTNAFPILRESGVKATIFLVPSCLGQTTDKVVPAGESARAHLSGENVLEMADYGIEFGSHTQNHKLLHQATAAEIEFEVTESKKQIENLLQKPCLTFAYPAGFAPPPAQKAVERAGYIAAFSTVYGVVEKPNLYALNRIEILRRDRLPFAFARKIGELSEN